ncbi:MAG: flagellin [Myxococcota bacterium]
MSMRIGSIGISYAVIRSLHDAENDFARASARLASGRRINRAADDAAGLALADRFRAEVASLSRAQMNTLDGIGLAQVAQGGLSEIASLLSEARALAVQSSSGALGGQTRAQLDDQFQSILSDIDAIAANTNFNSFNPLANDALQVALAVGTEAGDTITVSGVDAGSDAIGLSAAGIATASAAGSAIDSLDDAISTISALAARFGTAENRLESRSRLLGAQIEAHAAAESRIRDADFALESARMTRAQILRESAIAVLGQSNTSMRTILRLLE